MYACYVMLTRPYVVIHCIYVVVLHEMHALDHKAHCCSLSSDKNGYSLQTLVAKVE